MSSKILSDLLGVINTPITNFFDGIRNNPTAVNVPLQANALVGQLIAASPALEGVAIGDGVALLQEKWNAFVAQETGATAIGQSQAIAALGRGNAVSLPAASPAASPVTVKPSVDDVTEAVTEAVNIAATSGVSPTLAMALKKAQMFAASLSAK